MILQHQFALCSVIENYLNFLYYRNSYVMYSKTISEHNIMKFLELLRSQAPLDYNFNCDFKISKCVKLNGKLFPVKSPYFHYHMILQFTFNTFDNILINLQLTTNVPESCDWAKFTETNLLGQEKIQYISQQLYFYDLRFLNYYYCDLYDYAPDSSRLIEINKEHGSVQKLIKNYQQCNYSAMNEFFSKRVKDLMCNK